MHNCPHCGKEGITSWQKAFTGGFYTSRCRECHGEVNIKRRHYFLAMLPFYSILFINILLDMPNGFLFLVLSIVFFFIVQVRYIPLQAVNK